MGLFSLSGGVTFEPSTDIPQLDGKVILVTDANTGLGKQTVLELARHRPAKIFLTARTLDKANHAISEIHQAVSNVALESLELDLRSLQSVQKAAKVFTSSSERLDILFLNAGIMAHPEGITNDGYEIQFGTNHRVAYGSMLSKSNGEALGTVARYGQSKLAKILFAQELARRYRELTVSSVHPGIVLTNLSNVMVETSFWKKIAMKLIAPLQGVTVEEGVKNQLWASTAPNVISGEYYEPVGVAGKGNKYTRDPKLAEELLDWTEKELNELKL
ncbi:short-chain dehydrogenase reductase [Fusarium albosuccineum]|uniref:Short-chain dehydrogenase reductase n=1 Tax=Fusarium albosuccineum TaxID=1237068 RepID=A0A8H4LBI2_9HYPO|nr:short-chain dehydrogenase reductase [Fusarium albosuccineum]